MLENRTVLSLAELKAELKKLDLLKEEDEPFFVPIMHLLDHIFGQHFTYVYMKNGETAPDVTRENIWLVKDLRRYLAVLPSFCKQKKRTGELEPQAWEFHAYQKMIEKKYGISISIPELKNILGAHSKLTIKENIFFYREKSKIFVESFQLIADKGPLHFEEIAEHVGKDAERVHDLLLRAKEFILVGNSTFDLLEKHPEQRDIPWSDVRRKAHAFAPVYGFLRDAKEGLTIRALRQKMKDKGYKWSAVGINRILNDDERYRDFFVQIGLGLYALAEYFPELKNIPHSEITRKSPSFAAVYATIRDSEKKLKLSEIHAAMTQRGYKWSLGSVEKILTLGVKNNLFVRENQRYSLKSQEN